MPCIVVEKAGRVPILWIWVDRCSEHDGQRTRVPDGAWPTDCSQCPLGTCGTTVERDGCVDGRAEGVVPPCDGDGAQLDESPEGFSNLEEVHV